jgi:glycosyltransferase involved in cell wall biosynthesis
VTNYINRALYSIFSSIKDYRILGLLKELWKFLNPNSLEANQNYYIQLADYTDKDIIRNRELLDNWQKSEKSIDSMTWFIPMFYMVAAGVNNVFRFINFLSGKGVHINIVLMGPSIHAERCIRLVNDMAENRGQMEIFVNPSIADLPYADAGVATMWYTAYGLLKYNNTKGKFYFIQDDERLIYPGGLEHSLAESTYRFGFTAITNAECLKEMYITEFEGRADHYFPAPDHIKPVADVKSGKIKRIFFYARPEFGKCGFFLGMAGLREIKKRHPEIEIVTAGSAFKFNDYGLGINQFGKIPYDKLQDFYYGCDVGIYILLSRHTGVIPFELMASGCAVLVNRNCYKQSYLQHMCNCIMFDLSPSAMADAFDMLYSSEDTCREIKTSGLEFMRKMPSLEEELDRMYMFMLK